MYYIEVSIEKCFGGASKFTSKIKIQARIRLYFLELIIQFNF